MGIRCSKFHWDDLKTMEEVWDTNFLYYGHVWISKRGITLEPLSGLKKVYDEHLLFSSSCYKTWSLAVDYTDGSINDVIKIEIFYQSSSDTNMQSGTSMESPVAVPIDVRASSSIDKRKRAEMRETGNFLSILSNISLGYVWIRCLQWTREMYPHTPSRFLNSFTRFWKKTPEYNNSCCIHQRVSWYTCL